MCNRIAFIVVCGLLTACGSTTMTRSGPSYPARADDCEFTLLTTPAEGYAEIGAIDVEGGAGGSNMYRKLDDFKYEIRPHVCRAGGDAAIAYPNGDGLYIKATILKRVDVAPATETAATPAMAMPAVASGCQYDTQCKGDRICTDGKCVAPPAPAPVPTAD